MTFIKFCGMTREQDVAAAVTLGVNAMGFVLWPASPRSVERERARVLIRLLPADVTPVGVFVRPSTEDVLRAIDVGVRVVQIHGASDPIDAPAECECWRAASLVAEGIDPDVKQDETVLLDAHDPVKHGGTGRTIDWTQAARIAAHRRVILAGGLTPGNVAEAIRQVRPYGVDVASGVEVSPGVKDAAAMQAFVAAVREAQR
jgi:phosphoribosylanthranilate isomerase